MLRSKNEAFDVFKLWFQEPKVLGADLTAYELIGEESSLLLLFKAFAKNERLRLDTLHFTSMKKTA